MLKPCSAPTNAAGSRTCRDVIASTINCALIDYLAGVLFDASDELGGRCHKAAVVNE